MSANGGVIAFSTGASNLYEGDRNGSTLEIGLGGISDVYTATTTPGQGTISGQVYNDANGNGSQDAGDTSLSGWRVYLDANGNGSLDTGETSVVTDSSGNYALHGLAAGSYTVAIAPQANFSETHPAAPGTYAVTLATDTSTATGKNFGEHQVFADLKNQSVTLQPTSIVAGQSVNVSWSVKNQGQASATGTWEDAVFLSSQATLDAGAILVALVDHSGGLAVGSTYTGQTSIPIPGLAPGSYRVIVQVDYRNEVPENTNEANNVAASSPLAVTIPTLTPGVPVSGTFTGSGQLRYFQITPTPGQSLALSLQSTVNSGWLGLYISRNVLPTPYAYDFKPANLFLANQLVSVPVTQPGTYYILAESLAGSAANAAFSITASLPGFGIHLIGVTQGGRGGSVTIPINGSNLTPSTQVSLVSGGATIAASSIDFRDATMTFATFNLAGAAIGTYDVKITDGARARPSLTRSRWWHRSTTRCR